MNEISKILLIYEDLHELFLKQTLRSTILLYEWNDLDRMYILIALFFVTTSRFLGLSCLIKKKCV